MSERRFYLDAIWDFQINSEHDMSATSEGEWHSAICYCSHTVRAAVYTRVEPDLRA